MSWIQEIGNVYRKSDNSYFIEVSLKELDGVWPKLKDHDIARISSITVNDAGKTLEVIYHFVTGPEIINIKTEIPSHKPSIKSIVRHYPGAELIERELWETMGVEPVGHPDLRNFLLDGKLSPRKPGLKEDK